MILNPTDFMMDLSINYTYCKAEGINSDMLLRDAEFPHVECVKDLILELVQIQKSGGPIPWKKFAQWIQQLFQLVDPPSVWALRRSVVALQSKKLKLQKVTTKQTELVSLLDEPFQLPESHSGNATTSATTHAKQPAQSKFMQQAISLVNKSLASDLTQLENTTRRKGNSGKSMTVRDWKPNYETINHTMRKGDYNGKSTVLLNKRRSYSN